MRRVRMTRLPALFLLLSVGACTADGGDAEPIDLTAVSANLQGTAPDVFRARFETSKGDFVVEVHSWRRSLGPCEPSFQRN